MQHHKIMNFKHYYVAFSSILHEAIVHRWPRTVPFQPLWPRQAKKLHIYALHCHWWHFYMALVDCLILLSKLLVFRKILYGIEGVFSVCFLIKSFIFREIVV